MSTALPARCAVQLSHVLRQANAGLQMPWRDEALEVMAEHLGVRQTNHSLLCFLPLHHSLVCTILIVSC